MGENKAENERAQNKQDLAEDRTDWALHRSQLASERTFSAWVRTGLAAVVAGLGIARLLNELGRPEYTRTLGVLFTIAGGVFFAVGFLGYRRGHKRLAQGGSKVTPLWVIAILSLLLLACTTIAVLLVFE